MEKKNEMWRARTGKISASVGMLAHGMKGRDWAEEKDLTQRAQRKHTEGTETARRRGTRSIGRTCLIAWLAGNRAKGLMYKSGGRASLRKDSGQAALQN